MINTEIVDLYQKYGDSREGAKDGRLLCWTWRTWAGFSPRRRRPAVLIIPGGGYEHVSPREAEPVAMRFLARGYSAFVLEYSCAPSRFPTALREAAMAMRFIRENADAFEVDPRQVAAVGFSAGGHLCGTLGTLWDSPEVADIAPAGLLRPDALGLCYPVALAWGSTHEGSFEKLSGGDKALRAKLSLDALVRRDMPPVYLWHTRDDASVPVRNSLILAQALDEAGIPFAMEVFRQGPHGLSTADRQVYPGANMPEISRDIVKWPEKMMDFFEDCGFSIIDEEQFQ